MTLADVKNAVHAGAFGLTVIDKPAGITSNAVLSRVRRIASTKRAGHTGTLDPFATGVLVVGLGSATRLFPLIHSLDKAYRAIVQFGEKTDTADCTGKTITTSKVPSFTSIDLDQVAKSLLGRQLQIPPMYSAKKVAGVPSHVLARENRSVDLKAVEIEISSLVITKTEASNRVELSVVCSRGTYIRTLAETIAERLGTVGACYSLRRESSEGFTLDDAVPLDDFDRGCILPARKVLERFAISYVDEGTARRAAHGHPIELSNASFESAVNLDVGTTVSVFRGHEEYAATGKDLEYEDLVGMYRLATHDTLVPLMVFN